MASPTVPRGCANQGQLCCRSRIQARLHGAIAQGVLGDHPAASLEKLPHFIAPCSNPLFKAKGGFKPFGF